MARAIDADRLLKMMSHWKPYMDMDKVRKAVQNMPTLTPPNEWVAVEERLPEPTYCVLVYTTDYSIEVDALDSDGEWMSYEVTNWMPLPEPPAKEDQK